jgi:hypothetical protein
MKRQKFRRAVLSSALISAALTSPLGVAAWFATAAAEAPPTAEKNKPTASGSELSDKQVLPASATTDGTPTGVGEEERAAIEDKSGTDTGPRDSAGNAEPQLDLKSVPRRPGETGPSSDGALVTPTELPLNVETMARRDRIRRCLNLYYQDPVSVNDHSPWGIMHVLISYGVDTEIFVGERKVNAIGWLCFNGACRGQRLMYVEDGKLRVRIGPGVQGHPGQFLAMLAQSRVRPDYPIRVDGREFTVADLIESEKETCRAKTELTFKLIALSHYLKTDATWKNDLGEDWSIQRLIKEELAQPVIGAACGGTHRMTGFSYAVNKRLKMEESFEGQWGRAKKFVEDYHDYLFKLQNPDGSFSTNWFAGRGDWGEAPRRVETTGHMLEWLVCSLPKEQLDDPRVLQAVDFLTRTLIEGKQQRRKFEVGPRGHALHGLAIYNERRFGDKPGSRELIFARQPRETTIR